MKIIGFHTSELNIRGTNVAVYDYARYNEEILGNKSYIISNRNAEMTAYKKFQDRFEVFLYGRFEDSYNFAKEKNIEYVYYIKAGDCDGRDIPDTKAIVHAVFQHKDPHGHAYAYVSEWLANKMDMPGAFVPHIVDMPSPQKSYRNKLNISEDKIVIGRHGGYDEFNLPFVYQAIYNVLQVRDDIVFVFMNTRPFGPPHKNIIFIDKTYNMQHKSDYINTCDYMLHGRQLGESFGLAISEFTFHNKPVICWTGGTDQNHRFLLKDKGLWYTNGQDIQDILHNLKKVTPKPNEYSQLVEQFQPKTVMKRFNDIFLTNS